MTTLPASEVHVWLLNLDVEAARLARLESQLSGEERERAWRFSRPRERSRFVAARGTLREILATYLDGSPRSVRLNNSPFGKPRLAPESAAGGLNFNATRAESLGLIALRYRAEVGIDAERIRHLAGMANLLDRLLTPEERSDTAQLAESALQQRFFETWVGKEAVTKLLGIGLGQPFAELSLHPWHARGPRRLDLPPVLSASPVWLLPLDVPVPGYVAALATDAPIGAVRFAEWAPDRPESSAI